jgi:hypothetical protein
LLSDQASHLIAGTREPGPALDLLEGDLACVVEVFFERRVQLLDERRAEYGHRDLDVDLERPVLDERALGYLTTGPSNWK